MIEFDLKFNGKIRLWFDEIQELKFMDRKLICKDYEIISNKTFTKKIIIAEIFLPRGGRNIYGLLGIKYEPVQLDRLKIIASVNNKFVKSVFNDSLINKIEPAVIGISNEYSPFILNSVESLYNDGKLAFKGEVSFCYSAYAEISSNGWIFSKLTKILLNILQVSEREINSDMLMSLLD